MPELSSPPFAREPWLFLFAHPGHELRAFHFLERLRPTVAVLTDGSGATAESRLAESRALLERAGATLSPVFGPLTDRVAYAALMAADASPFLGQVEAIAETLVASNVRSMLVDAAEGYNPMHDVCHWMGRAAAVRAGQSGAPINLFELDLVAHPDSPGPGLRLMLDDAAFARKIEASARYLSLTPETDSAFQRFGRDAFRIEVLRLIHRAMPPPPGWVPYYEQVGEARVREGRYASALRYGTHVRRVIESLIETESPDPNASAVHPLHE